MSDDRRGKEERIMNRTAGTGLMGSGVVLVVIGAILEFAVSGDCPWLQHPHGGHHSPYGSGRSRSLWDWLS